MRHDDGSASSRIEVDREAAGGIREHRDAPIGDLDARSDGRAGVLVDDEAGEREG
jgi:hypothetical protein